MLTVSRLLGPFERAGRPGGRPARCHWRDDAALDELEPPFFGRPARRPFSVPAGRTPVVFSSFIAYRNHAVVAVARKGGAEYSVLTTRSAEHMRHATAAG